MPAIPTRPSQWPTAALLALLLLPVLPLAAAPPQDPVTAAPLTAIPAAAVAAGRWTGAIEIPGTSLEVTVDLAAGEDGSWSGDIDIPAQGASDLPLVDVSSEGGTVRFRIANVPGEPTFEGALAESDGTPVLEGTFTQGGGRFPFHVRRTGEAAVAERVSAEEALAGFDAWMTEQLDAFRVPGAAVAVVRDGEVVLAAGYGWRDREAELPASGDTLFAIGSATKAFTATVLALLADEGRLDWDEPVRTYLPEFRLFDDVATLRVTPRDLVSHRTGLPRHDLVWYGSPLGREELFQRLELLEPTEDLRSRFQYQNLMFMTAGYLAGRRADSDWELLVEERLFEPLGMEASNFTVAEMAASANHATAYEKEDEDGDGEDEVVPMPYRNITAVGPAGSINSTAADMARWLQLQLGGGAVDGERVVSAAALAELHQPLVVVQGGLFSALFQQPEMPYLMYGMGWFVQPYRGYEMVHHGGNIDGFSARVTFLPKDGLGVVVLTNLNGNPLPTVATLHLLDRFLDLEPLDWSGRYRQIQEQIETLQEQAESGEVSEVDRKTGTSPSHPLPAYAGTFRHAAYGDMEVTLVEGALHLAYHTLEAPLEHWHYDVFRAADGDLEGTKIRFANDLAGNLDRLEVTLEAGLEPMAFERLPPPELAQVERLRPYVGDYELMGGTVEVRLREVPAQEGGAARGVLSVTVPGQGERELVPVREGEFEVVGEEGVGVMFRRRADGEVEELIFLQPSGNLPARRVAGEGEDAEEEAVA